MIKVAIVEDRKDTLKSLEKLIGTSVDMLVTGTYSDGEDALNGILYKVPDIVLMDIDLPRMDGIECMMRLKQHRPKLLFLMFTVFEEDEKIFEALKAGADGYIIKKDPMGKILGAIREVKEQGAPMSRKIAKRILYSFREPVEAFEKSIESLSENEIEILEKLSKGFTYNQIASALEIKENAIKQRIHRIYKKLEVNNKIAAINKYLDQNMKE